jgi:hypothetical protein
MKLCVGIPVLDNVSWLFFLHTSALIGHLARRYELELCYVNRAAIDRARQMTVEAAISKECDRLLFIDDDTLIPKDTVERLEPLLAPDDSIAASGFCYQRGYKYMPMVYRYEDLVFGKGDCQLLAPWPEKPFQVSAVGMGISLLKVSLLKQIQKKNPPCFGREGIGTEDFYFFSKAAKLGFTTWVDPTLEATHMGNPVLVNSSNVDELRTSDFKKIYFVPDESGGRAQRGEESL